MRDKILQLIREKPRHYSQIIKKDPCLLSWVMSNTVINSDSLVENIRSAVYQETNICSHGNIRKISRINEGWTNCGPASTCACTKQQIALGVSITKQSQTSEEKAATNDKRITTMIDKFGVAYNSQRPEVKPILKATVNNLNSLASMKDIIKNIIDSKPKHYSKIIQGRAELLSWVMANSLLAKDSAIVEHIYSAVSGENNICALGNTKKFRDIKTGFVGCGKPNECICVRENVRESVRQTKAQRSQEQIDAENKKREQTNLQKYGVSNTGQTDKAISAHRSFYQDPDKVSKAHEKSKQTLLAKYGVENAAHIEGVIAQRQQTCLEKYGVSNVGQTPDERERRSKQSILNSQNGVYLWHGYQRFCDMIEREYKFRMITTFDEYRGSANSENIKYSFQCIACGHVKTQSFFYVRGIQCEYCNPNPRSFRSKQEIEVFEFITNELGIKGKARDRSLINPFELDMIFPDYKIAIEYCGLYWHSENGGAAGDRGKNYHAHKRKLVKQLGYRLITIFSDEWEQRPEIVKSRLASVFNKSRRIYARKCVIKEIDYSVSKVFMLQNHLQGHATPRLSLGLFYEDDLISVMTFSSKRILLNNQNQTGHWELLRFATKLGYTVVGGASKLLKEFIRKFDPVEIISYADLRWSDGNVYTELGFSESGTASIGYWYISNSYTQRHHRFKFRKAELVKQGANPLLSEWDIMLSLGYDRIYDCGQQKYTLRLK